MASRGSRQWHVTLEARASGKLLPARGLIARDAQVGIQALAVGATAAFAAGATFAIVKVVELVAGLDACPLHPVGVNHHLEALLAQGTQLQVVLEQLTEQLAAVALQRPEDEEVRLRVFTMMGQILAFRRPIACPALSEAA